MIKVECREGNGIGLAMTILSVESNDNNMINTTLNMHHHPSHQPIPFPFDCQAKKHQVSASSTTIYKVSNIPVGNGKGVLWEWGMGWLENFNQFCYWMTSDEKLIYQNLMTIPLHTLLPLPTCPSLLILILLIVEPLATWCLFGLASNLRTTWCFHPCFSWVYGQCLLNLLDTDRSLFLINKIKYNFIPLFIVCQGAI